MRPEKHCPGSTYSSSMTLPEIAGIPHVDWILGTVELIAGARKEPTPECLHDQKIDDDTSKVGMYCHELARSSSKLQEMAIT